MTGYIKDPHTTIFTDPMGCGKTNLVLDLIKKEYKKHFDYIIIIWPTRQWNKTYHLRQNDDKVWLIRPKDIIYLKLRCGKVVALNGLYNWIKILSQLLARSETLFITDDIIADETLDKKRQSLLELAISGRHRDQSLWLLIQSYFAIPKNLRMQAKAIFVWYPKERPDLKIIHDENNVLTDDELVVVRGHLKKSRHACLYTRKKHPLGFYLK